MKDLLINCHLYCKKGKLCTGVTSNKLFFLFCEEIPLSGRDLHNAVLNWEVEKVISILEERLVDSPINFQSGS